MIKYKHTNIVAKDWKRLSEFYQRVFDCRPCSQQRSYTEDWLAKGTGVPNASLEGEHLILPGHGEAGPTLEIFSYTEIIEKDSQPAANTKGFAHLAFEVDSVEEVMKSVLANGGKPLGEITEVTLGKRILTFVYLRDPEGNIVEIQSNRDSSKE